ncbi:MAG: chromosomal replication initiator protein DnaA [Planctomycetota bacterium]|nr:chromosomal replication initiator protein DnaA [Planctomycetota bacterium]
MGSAVKRMCADGTAVEHILATLCDQIGPQKFNAWFKHGTRLGIESDRVAVSVPNPFVANWIETHYQTHISAAVKSHTGQSSPVIVTVDPTLSGRLRKSQLDHQAELVARATQGRCRPRQPAKPTKLRHQLSNFVVGQSNKLAYSGAMAVADGKAPFNPLFIHGSCGVGKTHLLQGICHAALQRRGAAIAWRYLTAEQFTNDFLTAMRQKKLPAFRSRYRKLQLLAIDDVHFFSAKKATQEEFLHTFNAIESAGYQLVLASDAHPRLVGELNAQLTSRFVAGMVVKIEAPDKAVRMEILRKRAQGIKLNVSEDVLDYIALHIRGSVRELEGALIKLAAVAALEAGPVTLSMAAESLADHLARTDSAITLGDIEAAVTTFFGITPADIHSSRRTKTVSTARMIAMFLARRHTQMSYPEIGRSMGKNHSSVVLAVQRMEALLARCGELSWMTPMGGRSMPAKKLVELLSEQFS